MKQELIGCQWHQLDHTQIICTSPQTNAPTPRYSKLNFLQAGCSSCRPTNSVKGTDGKRLISEIVVTNLKRKFWYICVPAKNAWRIVNPPPQTKLPGSERLKVKEKAVSSTIVLRRRYVTYLLTYLRSLVTEGSLAVRNITVVLTPTLTLTQIITAVLNLVSFWTRELSKIFCFHFSLSGQLRATPSPS